MAHLLPVRIQIVEQSIPSDHIPGELARLEEAIVRTDVAMGRIASAASTPSAVGAELVETHRAMLKSSSMAEEARRLVRARSIDAESAVLLVLEQLRAVFTRIQDERFRARLADVEAVAERLLRSLRGVPELQLDLPRSSAIAIGSELAPLDALQLYRLGIAGFATEGGCPTSHVAIIARELGLPYAFGVKGLLAQVRAGELVCVDAMLGKVIVIPDSGLRPSGAKRSAAPSRARIASST